MIKAKRILAAVIAFCMVFALIPMSAFADDVNIGSCGPDLTWTYDPGTKTLTISGTGTMPDYYSDSYAGSPAPWIKSSSIGDNLEKVEILNGVANIGENAFYYCGKLKSITIANSVTSIGSNAFYHCDALPDITIPESVTIIGDDAFSWCNGLTSITIPGTVTSIGDGAFSSCDGLTSVTISDGVQSAGEYTFYLCNKLENISLPDSLTSIGVNAFYGTAYYNDETKWEDYVLYIGNHLIKTDEWEINHATKTEYTIKPGTISIADKAFESCEKLEKLTLPDSLVSIGNYTFKSCSGLTDIKIPQSVTNIGNYAFHGCEALTDVTIPDSVTSIGDYAFYGCKALTSACFKGDAPTVGSFAFQIYHETGSTKGHINIPGLTLYYIDGKEGWTTPTWGSDAYPTATWNGVNIPEIQTGTCGENLTWTLDSDGVLTISGTGAMNDYSWWNLPPWGTEVKTVMIANGVTNIGEYAFFDCSALTNITIP